MKSEVTWVLVSSESHVRLQIKPNPDYLSDYLSILMTMLQFLTPRSIEDPIIYFMYIS